MEELLSALLTGRLEDTGQLGRELGFHGREVGLQELGLQGRELGLQGRELGLQGRELGIQSRGLGLQEGRELGLQGNRNDEKPLQTYGNVENESKKEYLVKKCSLTENQGTFDSSDEDIKEKDMSEFQKITDEIESYTCKESKRNNKQKPIKRNRKDPFDAQAQPTYVAPKLRNSKHKAKFQTESKEVKLQAKKLQFELENSGLHSFEQTRRRCVAAAESYIGGKVESIAMAADYFNINQHTLVRGLKRGHFNKRPGKPTKVFTPEEERKLVAYIKSLDFEVTLKQIGMAIQEALLDVTKNNVDRKTGMENTGQVPHGSWVRRFALRNGIKPIKSL